jgi:hypothetical protein
MKKLSILFSLIFSLQLSAQREAEADQGVAVVAAVHERMASSGCWVRLYDEPLYRGNQLIVFEGMELPTLRLDSGSDWRGNVKSLEVGPRASVTLFRNENYDFEELTVEAGTQLPGPWLFTASLQLKCVSQDPAAEMDE